MTPSSRPELPGYWRFAWMFFMQPLSLHRRLKDCGIENPDASAWHLWRPAGTDRSLRRQYVARCFALLAGMIPCAFGIALGLEAFGVSITLEKVAVGVALGVAVGVVQRVAGVALGVPLGVALGVAQGVAPLGVAQGVAQGVALGVTLGVALGVTLGATLGVALGVAGGVALGVAGGVAIGVLGGVAIGVTHGVALGVTLGVAVGVTTLVSVPRLPLLLIEIPLQAALALRHRWTSTFNLDTSPIFWHELSSVPLPLLGEHIERTAVDHPRWARRALDQCAIIPGQRKTGQRVLERLRLVELADIGRQGRFGDLLDGRTTWQPPASDPEPDSTFVGLVEVARSIRAACLASTRDQRHQHLEQASRRLQGLAPYRRELRHRALVQAAVDAWTETVERLVAEVEAEGPRGLPNPFRAGEPLEPRIGRELFRGREDVVRRLERLLANPERAASIALLAPRRCGKTSMLKMLPLLLPDAVCVFFDLQGHPVNSPRAFFEALDHKTREQALREHGLRLPKLGDGPIFEAATAWLAALEEAAGDRRILLCLDEFETLEKHFPNANGELLRLMGLFRATIQHRRHVRLLISGEAPFEELGALWFDHFISVRELRLGHLEPATAVDLVRRPTVDFPAEVFPEEVALRIVERTGGQPFLVQLYAQEWVELLNEEERREASLDDLEVVEQRVLEDAGYYFNNRWAHAPAAAQEALAALARGEPVTEIERDARRWLQHRALVDKDLRLRIPVLGRFLVEEELI